MHRPCMANYTQLRLSKLFIFHRIIRKYLHTFLEGNASKLHQQESKRRVDVVKSIGERTLERWELLKYS